MANFDAPTLGELRDVQEVVIRTEKHPKSAVVIWVVVADDEDIVRITAYVLQVNGAKPGDKPLTRETAAAVNSVLE